MVEKQTTKKQREDRKLLIATGSNRFATKWKNKEISYGELVEKLSETTRTPESFKEFKGSSKADQSNIKDVGGFVGGALKDGRRKANYVMNRTLISLDMDEVNTTVEDVWETITMFNDYEVLMYSTHSHTDKKPRLRLVIPLDRPVMGDEYQAIARKVAEDIGIDMFDDTTYEPSRLMYWPSTSSDAEYVFLRQDGYWLKPDEVLARYPDWTDQSFWPSSSRQDVRITSLIKKQEDPLEKSGIIGAFCKTYSINNAIEKYLSDIYEPTAVEGRYTYKEGSTFGGLVVYDDKFAYSHHGTDAVSGMLCNAFDLVRIHKFGAMDLDAKENTPITRMPSFIKMQDFAREDEGVKKTLGIERLEALEGDFDFEDGSVEGDSESDLSWVQKLDYNRRGDLESTINNAYLILENDPRVAGRIKYDEFANRIVVIDDLPWRKAKISRDWTDRDDSGLRHFLESKYALTGNVKIEDARNLMFESNKIHPVRNYLNSLEWDGVKRLETCIIDYLGAADTEYTREVTKLHLVAAVARIFNPGTKYDVMVTLKGPQGTFKSTFIRLLCGNEWFSDSLDSVRGKEAAELIQGFWHIEMGELNATRKADREAIKLFLSKTEDAYRMPYGRNTSRFKRQCVFWGSTNESGFLRDPTGERRQHPIEVCVIDRKKSVIKDLEGERDQLWAEAVAIYREGFVLDLSPEMKAELVKVQLGFREDNPKRGLIIEYLNRDFPHDWAEMNLSERRDYLDGGEDNYSNKMAKKNRVCAAEIWCEVLGRKLGDLRQIDTREINDILRTIDGWEEITPRRYGKIYGNQRGYARKETTE